MIRLIERHVLLAIAAVVWLFPAAALANATDDKAAAEAALRARIETASKAFSDLVLDARVKKADQKELAVIGEDYGRAYEFESSKLYFKSPDKLRMSGKKGIISFNYVVNGDRKIVKAGPIRKTDDISEEPHKKQNALDVGVVTGSLWQFFTVGYNGAQTVNGRRAHVLELSLANSPAKKQYIWIDDQDLRLLRRQKHEADGSLRVRYEYGSHKQLGGIWIPGEVSVYNKNERLAGTSQYLNMKVNTGLTDKDFS